MSLWASPKSEGVFSKQRCIIIVTILTVPLLHFQVNTPKKRHSKRPCSCWLVQTGKNHSLHIDLPCHWLVWSAEVKLCHKTSFSLPPHHLLLDALPMCCPSLVFLHLLPLNVHKQPSVHGSLFLCLQLLLFCLDTRIDVGRWQNSLDLSSLNCVNWKKIELRSILYRLQIIYLNYRKFDLPPIYFFSWQLVKLSLLIVKATIKSFPL